MRIRTCRNKGDGDRVTYSFTAELEEKDLCVLYIAEGDARDFVVAKLKECTLGRPLPAVHGFNEAICNKCKYQKPTLPVYYIQVEAAFPAIAMYDEVPDPLNNVQGKMNPDFSKWDESRLLVQLWASSLEQHFFVFSNCTFFDQGYGKGNPEREFDYDVATREATEVSGAAPAEPEKEPAKAEEAAPTEPDTGRTVPETMPEIWKLIGHKEDSKYDFGVRTLSPAGKTPTFEAAVNAYRRNMLLTVGRALICKLYGKVFTPEEVRKSAIASWKTSANARKYREVLHGSPEEAKAKVDSILSMVKEFMAGKCKMQQKYMLKYHSTCWNIVSFTKYCKVYENMNLKPSGYRGAKRT